MDLVSLAAAVLKLVDWKKIAKDLATDRVKGAIFRRLQPDEREKAARAAVGLFVEEFLGELEDKTPLSASVEGYRDHLARLAEIGGAEIAEWLQPEVKEVDLAPVERMWRGMGAPPLPDFDWSLVARNYARALRKQVRGDAELRARLAVALQEEAAESVSRLAGPAPGFDLTGYRKYLEGKCCALQLAVMHTSTYGYDRQVTLWSVFVPQTAREAAPVRDLPREIVRRLREEGHGALPEDDQDLERMREAYQGAASRPVLETLETERLVVVLGDPGSGKTSLVKYLALRWAREDRGPLPLWIDLKEYVRDRRGFLEYLDAGCSAYRLDARELDRRLQAGEAALYLDGLDEIFEGPVRGSVMEEAAAFAARYGRAPVVVTSRILGYEQGTLQAAGFVHATLEDFDDDQVREFLSRWHEVAEIDPKERTRLLDRFERALHDSRAIRDLAGNPLLLTMAAILNRNQELPRDRVELYREASRVLLHEWDASRSLPVDTFGRQEKEGLLRELAGVMQQAEGGLAGNLIEREALIGTFTRYLGGLGIPDAYGRALSLVHQLTERNFILCFAGADRFSFVHRTFLEYYCAAWIVERFEKKQTLTFDQLREEVFGRHWRDETWHEVLRLIAGMIGEAQAGALIEFLMQQDGSENKLANLMLAAWCLSEVRNRGALRAVGGELWRRFVEEVVRYDPPYYYERYQESTEVAPTRARAVALIASVWRGGNGRSWLLKSAVQDRDWIVRLAAVQELARGWKQDPDTLRLLKDRARSDESGIIRLTAVRELARGWRQDPDTLAWFTERARSDDKLIRRAAVQELARGWKQNPGILPWLKERARSDEHEWVREAALQELARGWKQDPGILPWLKERARSVEDPAVWPAAVRELARGRKQDPDTLVWLKERACADSHPAVRQAAVQELARGWKQDPDTLPLLKNRACFDEHEWVRQTAVQELARGWKQDPDTLRLLKYRALSHKDPAVRGAAVQELARGWKEDPDTLPFLKNCARRDERRGVRLVAVEEVARGWKQDPDTRPWLKDRACFDEDWAVRQAAVRGLARGCKQDRGTLAFLQDRARLDEQSDVRRTALQEVARSCKQDPETLPWLKEHAHSGEDEWVRRAAVQELARGWKQDPDSLPLLKDRARSDESEAVRHAALDELARGWPDDPEVAALLVVSKTAGA